MSINTQVDSVAADMERIFRPIATRSVAAGRSRDEGVAAGRRHRSRWLMFGAPVMVLLAGAALGVTYVREEWHPQPSPARPVSRPAQRPPESAVTRPVASVESARPAPEAVDERDIPPATPSPTHQASADDTHEDVTPPRAASVGPIQGRRIGNASTRPQDCAPGSPEDRCIYQDVLNADGRLHRAYERARQSGVADRDLAAVNRRWRQARDLAGDDPDGTIRRYDQLADALDDLRRETGE